MDKGICSKCGLDTYIVNKTKRLCSGCNYRRLHNGLSRLQVKILSFKESNPHKTKKATGELELFKQIWLERIHVCEKCGKILPEPLKPIYFSHIKSKGAYPELRLDKNNIELNCIECHQKYEFGVRK